MKKIIILVLALGTFPGLISAQEIFPVLEDRIETYQKNIETKQALVQQFGQTAFDRCLSCPGKELTNPYSYFRCLENTRTCLGKKIQGSLNCPEGQFPLGHSCVSVDFACKADFGPGAFFNGQIKERKYICECGTNYAWNKDGSWCEAIACPENMLYYSPLLDEHGVYQDGRCYLPDEICQTQFGESSFFKQYNQYGQIVCSCGKNQEYDSQTGVCTDQVVVLGFESENDPDFQDQIFIKDESAKLAIPDAGLIDRLKGRLLVQVEAQGQAWYLEPVTGFRYFLSRPEKAWEMMRRFGLGVKHETIENKDFSRLKGRILIDVEDLGRAYYIDPTSVQAHYLGRPADAFGIMRQLGLGIKNSDLNKLPIGN